MLVTLGKNQLLLIQATGNNVGTVKERREERGERRMERGERGERREERGKSNDEREQGMGAWVRPMPPKPCFTFASLSL